MLAIEAWGRGKFKPMVVLAHVVAASATECHELILQSRGPWLLTTKEAVGIRPDAWLDLYRQPLSVEAATLQFIGAPDRPRELADLVAQWPLLRRGLSGEFAKGFADGLTKRATLRSAERADRFLNRIYTWVHLPMMRRLLEGDEGPPAEFRQWLAQPEFMFLMLVALPCWLEYQRTPWELFQQARRGDFEALEKLVRLDPEVDKDQRLARLVFRLRGTNPAQYELLQQARSEGRTKRITLADVKYSLGGLLLRWSKELQAGIQELTFQWLAKRTAVSTHGRLRRGIKAARRKAEREGARCRLTAPDIKGLFDAIARDSGQGMIDPDLAGQPNSIFKRLDRNAQLWPSLRETDRIRTA